MHSVTLKKNSSSSHLDNLVSLIFPKITYWINGNSTTFRCVCRARTLPGSIYNRRTYTNNILQRNISENITLVWPASGPIVLLPLRGDRGRATNSNNSSIKVNVLSSLHSRRRQSKTAWLTGEPSTVPAQEVCSHGLCCFPWRDRTIL